MSNTAGATRTLWARSSSSGSILQGREGEVCNHRQITFACIRSPMCTTLHQHARCVHDQHAGDGVGLHHLGVHGQRVGRKCGAGWGA